MKKIFLNSISKTFDIEEIDVGNYKKIKAGGMTFDIAAYKAKGLGHVSVMSAKGFFGLMKMDTLIVNPCKIDLPLYSYDRIKVFGKDILIAEIYDTSVSPFDETELSKVISEYHNIEERDPGVHWYDGIKLKSSISKKGKKKDSALMDELALKHFNAYLSTHASGEFDADRKKEKTLSYVDGLIDRGGPSTDVFKKELGYNATKELFYNVLFGIKTN